MYAIVEINGQQFKAEQGKKLFVHHNRDAKEGQAVEFEKVLLIDKDGSVEVGAPTVEGAKVVCEVVNRFQDEAQKRLSKEEWSSRTIHRDCNKTSNRLKF